MSQPQKQGPINWTNEPTPGAVEELWEIKRAPEKGRATWIILSHQPVGTPVHFVANRSKGCTGSTCKACATGNVPREKGYIAACSFDLRRKVILEVSANVWKQLYTAFCKRRTIRGLGLDLWRPSGKPNGRIAGAIFEQELSGDAIPKACNVEQKLTRMWEQHWTETPTAKPTTPLRVAPTGTDGEQPNGHRDTAFD